VCAVALRGSGVEPGSPAAGEAVTALRASIRANPSFAPARAELGRLLLKRDEVDLAIRELEKAVELDPGSTPALYALSQACLKKGDRARAQEMVARVSKLNAAERGDDPDRELRRAVVRIVRESTAASGKLGESGPGEAAAEAFGEAIPLGRLPEAVAAYESALWRQPESVEARYGLSVTAAELGDLDGTIQLLREVTARSPGLADAWYDLGVHLQNRYRAGRGLRRPADLDDAERAL